MLADISREAKGYSAILLSSEILSEPIDWQQLKLFEKIADEIKIILYLRRQPEYIESAYNEHVKSAAMWKPFEAFDYETKLPNLDYWQLCEKWANLVGEKNLILRPFEPAQFEGGSLFSDFASIFPLKADKQIKLPSRKINISLTRDELEFKRLLNSLAPVRKVIPALLQLSHQRMQAPGYISFPLFSDEQRRKVLESYAATNQMIAQKYLQRADGQLFRGDSVKGNGAVYPGFSSEKAAEIKHFLQKNHPDILAEIRLLVQENRDAAEAHKRDAAAVLGEGLG